MAESRAGTAAGTDSIALELALPTDHAGQPLGLGDAGVVDISRLLRRSRLVVSILLLAVLQTGFGRVIHCEWSRSVGLVTVLE